MTCIAAVRYADGSAAVAADSRVGFDEDDSHFPTNKLRKTKSGIVTAAGDADVIEAFFALMNGEDVKWKREWTKSDFEGLLVARDRIVIYSDGFAPDATKRTWHAIGSGGAAALAVFAFCEQRGLPLDPRHVVRAVCEVNAACGGPIDYLRLSVPRKPKGAP